MIRLIATLAVFLWVCLLPKHGIRSSKKEPPPFVFSVIWTLLFLIYGLSWEYIMRHHVPDYIDLLFWVNLVLPLVWVYVYFVYQDKTWSKIILAIMIVVMYCQIYTIWFHFPDVYPNYFAVVELGLCVYISWLLIAFFLLMGW